MRIGPRNHIDFMKVDVEGAELEAICSSCDSQVEVVERVDVVEGVEDEKQWK